MKLGGYHGAPPVYTRSGARIHDTQWHKRGFGGAIPTGRAAAQEIKELMQKAANPAARP